MDQNERRIRFGGVEYRKKDASPWEEELRYHGAARPGEDDEPKKRGGFFSRRGSILLFIDLIFVAVLSLTIYPIYGRKDRDRYHGYEFTLRAEAFEQGVYYDLQVESPGKEEKLLAGELFTVVFSNGEQESEKRSVELSGEPDQLSSYRRFIAYESLPEKNLVSARIAVGGEEMLLRLELKDIGD